MVGHVWRHLQTRCFISQCGAFAGRHTAMASIEMVRPRGQGRGATSATTADAETLLPASEPPASARTRSAAPVAVARNGVGLFERIGDVADAMLPPPPRPRDPADRRRVWTWATVSFLLMCLMFASVAGGPGGRGTRTRQIELDASSSSIGNQQRDGERAGTSAARGSGLADDSKRAELESSAESDEIDDASDASAARTDDAFKPDTSRDDESIASEISGSIDSATAFVDVPIPRTKGTCVTRAARVPAVVDLDPTLIAPAAGGGGGASGSAQWRELADALAAEATNATADLVLVGDSITEAWRGTAFGAPKTAYASAPEILAWRLGQHAPLPLAIAGDTTANVLWRLRNGGFPERPPAYVVLLIGTNDLSRSVMQARQANETNAAKTDLRSTTNCASDADVEALFASGVPTATAGIVTVVEELVALAPSSKIVVLGITPRGERIFNKISYLQPSVWTAAIDAVNARVERTLENGKRGVSGSRFGGSQRYRNVVFQPCAEPFLVRDAAGGGKRVDERLMRDGLHPAGAGGFDALGECVVAGVEKARRTIDPQS